MCPSLSVIEAVEPPSDGPVVNLPLAFKVSPKIISPNNDGVDDQLLIQYQLNQPGYMCSAYLFGLNGNMIMKIIDNQLLGTSGSIIWSGLHQQQILPSGQYIILIEAFHLNGKTIREKMLIAIK